MIGWLKNWWRGYSEDDVASLVRKLNSDESRKIDGIIELTRGEMKARLKVINGRIITE